MAKRVRNVKTDIMKKEELVANKSRIYNKAMEDKKLSVEQIKELRDLDFKIEKHQVNTRFEYETTVQEISTPKTFEEKVVRQTCSSNWFSESCENTVHTVTGVRMEEKTIESKKLVAQIPEFELKVHIVFIICKVRTSSRVG